MKRFSVSVSDELYQELNYYVKKNKITKTDLFDKLLKEHLNIPKEIINVEDIFKTIKEIEVSLSKVKQKQNIHFNLALQHFVNQGFRTNLDINFDECSKEILYKKDKFND